MSTRREILDRIAAPLRRLYDDREARSIALRAATELSGLPVTAFLTDPSAPLDIADLDPVIARLSAGRPVQYEVGRTEFCGLTFTVREGVLIPRPETEELVAWVAETCSGPCSLLDVGTGSGCIAVSLKKQLPEARVFAADISDEALAVAAENARTLGTDVTFGRADALHDLAEVFPGPFDMLISNPPYVPQSDLSTLHPNVRDFEPHTALLVPDDDPLLFYRAIARAGRQMLTPGGKLYFEIYYLFAEAMCEMLAEEGYTATEVREDMYGKPRMTCSTRN